MPLVVIDPVTHYRIAQFAQQSNISIDLAIIEITCDWLDSREATQLNKALVRPLLKVMPN